MRILHVIPTYVPAWRYGGPIHSVHGLCKALASRGHEVDVATTNVDGDGESDVPIGTPVHMDGIRVHYFRSRVLRRIYFSPQMRRFLAKAIAGVDIVHTHSVFLWPTTAAASLARANGKPYVLSPRGMLVSDLIARRSPLLKRTWIRLFERRNVAEASAVHVTSDIERKELLELGLTPRRIFEIPNGLDISAPSGEPTAERSAENPEYILFLGRISWKKGLDRLIQAMARSPGIRLIVAGNDDEGYWQKMMTLADQLGVSGRIFYQGYVEGAAKDVLISQAMALVLPSYSENFGNVVLEAMARAIPVIVTPEVGLAATVESTRSGIVVRGEPDLLAAAITSLAGDARLRADLGRNGHIAAQSLSWSRIAERMEMQYANLVNGQPA